MFGKKKRKMRNFSVIISICLLFSCSQQSKNKNAISFSGFTQGTTYNITIVDDSILVSQLEIDQLLAEFDTVLSTYIDESYITQLNNSKDAYSFVDKHAFFKNCYHSAKRIYINSNGLFDPSVYPLVKAWGFFKKEELIPTQSHIDSIKQFIGFEEGVNFDIQFSNDSVSFHKKDARYKLDFNGIAQGYSADVIADFLEKKGYKDYYVEIGGEIRVKGQNKENENWKIGIDTPTDSNSNEEQNVLTTIDVTDCGIATSGNYRNYFKKDGKKYGHILNPTSGYPTNSDISSVTVIAPSAALADGYATVFYLLGKEGTLNFLSKHTELKVILVYMDNESKLNIYSSPELFIQYPI